VLGHLDLLVREGLVREQPGEEIIRFEAIPLSEAIGSHE
jgi:hypothetical protein